MYKIDELLAALGRELIGSEARFEALQKANICYLRCDKAKATNGRTVFADTEKPSDKWRAISGYDFIITFYADAEDVSFEAARLLMKHALCHCGYDPETCQRRIIPHDVQDFRALIEENGIDYISK